MNWIDILLLLVIAFSVYVFASHGLGTAGVAPGKRLHLFVAPLATSPLNGDANVNPRCDPKRPNPQALNVSADYTRFEGRRFAP